MPAKKVSVKKDTVKPAAKEVKVVKTTPKSVVKPVEKKPTVKTVNLSIPVFSLSGKENGNLDLPKELFGSKVNTKLLSQAVRVYSTNQRELLAKTKTRGEIKASKAKIYRQKGTGRARHGAISAPIFVGGGIVFGPQPRKVRLNMPKAMKKASLISALSSKLVDKNIVGLSGAEKATGKTKEIASFLEKINPKKTSALIVTGERVESLIRGVSNIPGVSVLPANLINSYEVLKHNMLLVTKEAVEALLNPKEIKK